MLPAGRAGAKAGSTSLLLGVGLSPLLPWLSVRSRRGARLYLSGGCHGSPLGPRRSRGAYPGSAVGRRTSAAAYVGRTAAIARSVTPIKRWMRKRITLALRRAELRGVCVSQTMVERQFPDTGAARLQQPVGEAPPVAISCARLATDPERQDPRRRPGARRVWPPLCRPAESRMTSPVRTAAAPHC